MILEREAESLHRKVLECQKEFGAICQKQFDVFAREDNCHVRIFHFGVRILGRTKFVGDIKSRTVEQRCKEVLDSRPQ
jgi:hypothetical protein